METTTLQIRIDKKTKEGARKVFEKVGLDMSSAIKLFLKQANNTKTLPIKGLTENGFTPEYEDELIREAEWAKKHGKRYASVDQMFDDILK